MNGSTSLRCASGAFTPSNEGVGREREIARATADADVFIAKMTTTLTILRRWIEDLEAAEKGDHWRTQPRMPAGVPEGGQWTDEGPYSGSDSTDEGADFGLWLRPGRRIVQAQARPGWRDPWPQSPLTEEFRNELAARESRGRRNHGYSALIIDANRRPVLGRYQFDWGAQIELGLRSADGAWNRQNRYGARTMQEFLALPIAQERALADYVSILENQLETNGSMAYLDQRIEGVVHPFTVAMPGLVAAAHRGGARGVRNYLGYIEDRHWTSDVDRIPDRRRRDMYSAIESRLREFRGIPYRR